MRSPQVDAPVAALGSVGNTGTGAIGQFCFLFGTTKPFGAAKLKMLYSTHTAFATHWDQATQKAVTGGFLRKPDAVELNKAAAASKIA